MRAIIQIPRAATIASSRISLIQFWIEFDFGNVLNRLSGLSSVYDDELTHRSSAFGQRACSRKHPLCSQRWMAPRSTNCPAERTFSSNSPFLLWVWPFSTCLCSVATSSPYSHSSPSRCKLGNGGACLHIPSCTSQGTIYCS